MSPNKTTLASIITLALLNAAPAIAAQVQYANFTSAGAVSNLTLLSPNGTGATAVDEFGNYTLGGPGYTYGSTNNVTFTWDGTLFNSMSDYSGPGSTSNASISSPMSILGIPWTAHTVQLFGPGTYNFDTSLGGNTPESGIMTMTVAPGQIGMHMLWDWNGNLNIDIANAWNLNSTFSNCGSTDYVDTAFASNCLYDNPGTSNPAGNTASTVFTFASTDNDGDGTLGIPMALGGPFSNSNESFNFNFNLQGTMTSVVPIPGAVWLFGSGLLGLFGAARHKKA